MTDIDKWKVESIPRGRDYDDLNYVTNGADRTIADLYYKGDYGSLHSFDDADKNARLIAAAPALLEAAIEGQKLVKWISEIAAVIGRDDGGDDDAENLQAALDTLNDAMYDGFLASYRDQFNEVIDAVRGENQEDQP